MRSNKKLVLASALVLPVFTLQAMVGFAQAPAHNDDMPTSSDQAAAGNRKTGNEALTLQQRLAKRKAAAAVRLNAAQTVRLKTRCKAAQGHISRIKGRVTGIKTSRVKAYDNLLSRLNGLSPKLKAKSIDTVTFDTQIIQLKSLIEAFHIDLAKYEEAVSDLAAMDCAADPEGFKASLETARSLRAQVVKDGQAIAVYLKATVKPTLVEMRHHLSEGQEE